MSLTIRAEMLAGFIRIKVAPCPQTGLRLALFFAGFTGRVFMQMKAMLTRWKPM
jgi:hypothetical protein